MIYGNAEWCFPMFTPQNSATHRLPKNPPRGSLEVSFSRINAEIFRSDRSSNSAPSFFVVLLASDVLLFVVLHVAAVLPSHVFLLLVAFLSSELGAHSGASSSSQDSHTHTPKETCPYISCCLLNICFSQSLENTSCIPATTQSLRSNTWSTESSCFVHLAVAHAQLVELVPRLLLAVLFAVVPPPASFQQKHVSEESSCHSTVFLRVYIFKSSV